MSTSDRLYRTSETYLSGYMTRRRPTLPSKIEAETDIEWRRSGEGARIIFSGQNAGESIVKIEYSR